MKKLSKVVLAASMFAALFAGCSNGGLVANDVLDAPELEVKVTENGVAVLTWQPVKDAADYLIYVKEPGTEEWQNIFTNSIDNSWQYSSGQVNSANFYQRRSYSYNVTKLDSEYKFKLVAASNMINVLSSETEVSVDTPEAWVDTAAPAGSSIGLTLEANTLNKYVLSCPVDAGFNYNWRIVKATAASTEDAKDLYYANATSAVESWTNSNGDSTFKVGTYANDFDGADFITELDDDDNVVTPDFTTFVLPDDSAEYRVVIKMTAKNPKVATDKYVLSSASVKFDSNGIVYGVENPSVDNSKETKSVITFYADKYNATEIDASSYRIYQVLKTTKYDAEGVYIGIETAVTNLGTASKDTDHSYNDKGYVGYTKEVTVAEASKTAKYEYSWYAVYTAQDNSVVWTALASRTVAKKN